MLLTPDQWETAISAHPDSAELRRLIMWTDARGDDKKFPDGYTWRHKKGWLPLLRIFTEREYATENVDFLVDLDAFFAGTPGFGKDVTPTKQDLFHDYVAEAAPKPINISDPLRKELAAALQGGDDSTLRTSLEAADRQVTGMVTEGAYLRMQPELTEVQKAWAKVEEAGKAKVGPVQSFERHERPAPAKVNEWNQQALRALSRSAPTPFFHLGDMVIVANPAAGQAPPGIGWLQQQLYVVTGTVTKRGGLFGAASILAKGVQNEPDFEGALRAAVPDIQIEYPQSIAAQKQKVTSAFGRK